MNYMAARGLAEQGEAEWAERIRADSARLIETAGFYESFSPATGEGSSGAGFTMTAPKDWLPAPPSLPASARRLIISRRTRPSS